MLKLNKYGNVEDTVDTGAWTDANATGSGDLASVNDDTGHYKQKNIAQLALMFQRRGVSFKEALGIRQSGMLYDAEARELFSGTTSLTRLVQKYLLQGNQSQSGGTASNEMGAYNASGFDGFRLITAGADVAGNTYSGAIRVDQDLGTYNMTTGINHVCSQIIDQGGMPSALIMSAINKEKLMNEQEGKQRTEGAELVPGVKVQTVATVAGDLPVVMVPGAAQALGTYNRTSDSVLVGDVYVLTEDTITFRYLGDPNITVLEIPPGVDSQLSKRWILYLFGAVEVADGGFFQGRPDEGFCPAAA